MSDLRAYREALLARKAALQTSLANERPAEAECNDVHASASAGILNSSTPEVAASSGVAPRKRTRTAQATVSTSSAAAPAPAVSAGGTPAPEPPATPANALVPSPVTGPPFKVVAAHGMASNYIFSPLGDFAELFKTYYSSSAHLNGILAHCGFEFEDLVKPLTQAQLRFYVSVISGSASFFDFNDDGSVRDSDFIPAPPDFPSPAAGAQPSSA